MATRSSAISAILKKLEVRSFRKFFADHLPYYSQFITDHKGNIIVFNDDGCFEECPTSEVIIAPEGEDRLDTKISIEGVLPLKINSRFKNVSFLGRVAVALIQDKEDQEGTFKLIKMVIQ